MALKKMQPVMVKADDNLSAMKISSKSKSWIMTLFSSHPELDERIKNLEDLRIN
jgi:Zn-dependent protease with chaperone function